MLSCRECMHGTAWAVRIAHLRKDMDTIPPVVMAEMHAKCIMGGYGCRAVRYRAPDETPTSRREGKVTDTSTSCLFEELPTKNHHGESGDGEQDW